MPAGTLQDVLGFTTVAATTAGDIAASANLPFLGGAATLTLSIVQFVKVSPISWKVLLIR
jgi:hypothetical protein